MRRCRSQNLPRSIYPKNRVTKTKNSWDKGREKKGWPGWKEWNLPWATYRLVTARRSQRQGSPFATDVSFPTSILNNLFCCKFCRLKRFCLWMKLLWEDTCQVVESWTYPTEVSSTIPIRVLYEEWISWKQSPFPNRMPSKHQDLKWSWIDLINCGRLPPPPLLPALPNGEPHHARSPQLLLPQCWAGC